MTFIERLFKNCIDHPEKTAVVTTDTGTHITYGQLWELSGKVYGYLKDNGFGKGSVCMISLPRGIHPIVCLIGIWRAGGAAVMLEADHAPDRKQYIYENSGCSVMADMTTFSEMMEHTPVEGYAETSDHDLAYIVYTSGTTGKPKGAMQEYGMMQMCVSGNINNGSEVMAGDDKLALTTPLNFAATLLIIIPMLYNGGTLVVFPMDVVRDPVRLISCLDEYRISITFISASILGKIKTLPPSLKKVITGGEQVRNIYPRGVDAYCLYAQSESCFNLASFKIDREYDITPVGGSFVKEADVCILDDNGEPLPDGAEGNICYKAPYFRGYLGLEEETAKIRINGYTKTGDLGVILPDGNLLIKGRCDDMIKIRGNRVEPAEVESALKKVLGVSWAGVRAFTEQNATFICAYYTEDTAISIEDAKKGLKNILASYMIPSYYVRIDSIPVNENGKFSRKLLPMPDRSMFRAEYVEPSGEEEKMLCAAMSDVLGTQKVGAEDDFYDMGGDSVSVMVLLDKLDWPGLEVSTIIKGRTPRGIAGLYLAGRKESKTDIELRDKKAMEQDQPLNTAQLYMFDYQCYVPKSTAWNLYMLLRLAPEVDVERVRLAMMKVMKAHPVFSTMYCFNEDTELVQRYDPDTDLSIDIENISEAELVEVTESLLQPYRLLGSKLYRIRMFKTERGGYIYIDMHHSIADGTSIQILIRDLCDAYDGRELPADHYYLKLVERRQEERSNLYREGKEYFSGILDQNEWDSFPRPDHDIGKGLYGNMTYMIPIEDDSYDRLHRLYGVSRNAFYITTSLLAIATYNGSDDIRISWTFNGRESEGDANIIGTLIKSLYVGVRLGKDPSIKELFDDVVEQIRMGIVYSCYPYPGPERINDEGLDANLIYQSDLRNIAHDRELKYCPVDIPKKTETADNLLDIEIHETENGCKLYMDYMADCYEYSSISRFRRIFVKTACLLIKHLSEPDLKISVLRKEADSE